MIFKIIPIKDGFLEKIYTDSIKSLNEFYEIGWVHHTPTIFVVDNREDINDLRQEKTEDWSVGWIHGSMMFVLNRDNLEKESSHKYNPDRYAALVKHELSHCFYNVLSNHYNYPNWLWEGVAIYTSGQNRFSKKPEKFAEFLEFYNHGGKGVYSESGFFVQALVEKFGKQKLLDLVKGLKNIKTKEEFEQLFAKQYGFNLNYNEINAQKLI